MATSWKSQKYSNRVLSDKATSHGWFSVKKFLCWNKYDLCELLPFCRLSHHFLQMLWSKIYTALCGMQVHYGYFSCFFVRFFYCFVWNSSLLEKNSIFLWILILNRILNSVLAFLKNCYIWRKCIYLATNVPYAFN